MAKDELGVIHPIDNPNLSKRVRVEKISEVDGRIFRIVHLEAEIYPEEIDSLIVKSEYRIADLEYQLKNEKQKLNDLKNIKEGREATA